MFAPKVAKPQIKAAESSTLVRGRSAAFARPFGVWAREARGDHEQEAEPTLDREAPRRLDWSLSGISILSPDAPRSVLPLSGLPAPTLQPKLAIGSVDDPLEHEADRVADQVMRMPDSALSISPGSPQLSRKCAECEEEDQKKLQMKSTAVPQAAGRRSAPDSARPNMMTRPKCMPCPNWRESAIQVSVKQTRCLASARRDPR
jgi:hypothetical protein